MRQLHLLNTRVGLFDVAYLLENMETNKLKELLIQSVFPSSLVL